MGDGRRAIPSVGMLLQDPDFTEFFEVLNRRTITSIILGACDMARRGDLDAGEVRSFALRELSVVGRSLVRLINATGVVIHTNLGRAPLSDQAILAMHSASGYTNIEFDIRAGDRAPRAPGAVASLRRAIPLAEDAMFVNNGAAALILACCVVPRTKRIIMSRGEMVEIGAGFRLPDLIRSAGVDICEVGTTNRTTIQDYESAIRDSGDAIVKIHPSNFIIQGFTASVSTAELSTLGIPIVVDIGSGLLSPSKLLPKEPDVETALKDGASIVTFSGDKILGGPQAGILAGKSMFIESIRKFPMTRAMRADKLTAAALEATLNGPSCPVLDYIHADPEELLARCQAIANSVEGAAVVPSIGSVGGGSGPGVQLDGWAIALPPSLAVRLREGNTPVVGRIEKNKLLLDLRCVSEMDDAKIIEGIRVASKQVSGS